MTTWADPSTESVSEHYGGSYLFMRYFLDRFGEDLTKAVVASPKNGIAGFNEALEKAGRSERFDDIFADWVVANYLDAPDADASGRYGYKSIDVFPMAVSEEYNRYPASGKAQVSQYGVDYIRLKGREPLTIRFEGQSQTPLVDATPQGTYSWWSNRGDQSNSTLTRVARPAQRDLAKPAVLCMVRDRRRLGLRLRRGLDRRRQDVADPARQVHNDRESSGQRLRSGLDRHQWRRRPAEVGRGVGGPERLRRQGDPAAL